MRCGFLLARAIKKTKIGVIWTCKEEEEPRACWLLSNERQNLLKAWRQKEVILWASLGCHKESKELSRQRRVQQEKKQGAALRGESEHERTSNGRAQQSNAEDQRKEREEFVHELTELRESERKVGESFCE